MATISHLPLAIGGKSAWIFDSGATNHFTHDRLNFVTYRRIDPLPIGTADEQHIMHAIGVGKVEVAFSMHGRSTIIILENVLHVPALQVNLLAHPQLAKHGICTRSNPTYLYLKKRKTSFGRAKLVRSHWVLDLEVRTARLASTTHNDLHRTSPSKSGANFSMGQFSAGPKLTSKERFMHSSLHSGKPGAMPVVGRRASHTVRSSSLGGLGAMGDKRTQSKHSDATYNETNRINAATTHFNASAIPE